jgi:hypothetical protein
LFAASFSLELTERQINSARHIYNRINFLGDIGSNFHTDLCVGAAMVRLARSLIGSPLSVVRAHGAGLDLASDDLGNAMNLIPRWIDLCWPRSRPAGGAPPPTILLPRGSCSSSVGAEEAAGRRAAEPWRESGWAAVGAQRSSRSGAGWATRRLVSGMLARWAGRRSGEQDRAGADKNRMEESGAERCGETWSPRRGGCVIRWWYGWESRQRYC